MRAVIAKQERDHLLQEIFDALRRWPDLDRRVFFLSHYRGQSVETISRALQLEADNVENILRQCEQRLHASLRNFRENNGGQTMPLPTESACPAMSGQMREKPSLLPFTANSLCDIFRIAV